MAAVRALRLAATMASFAAADLSKLKPPKAGHVRLYLCRHGQTDWNAAKRIQGSVDKELNAMGHRQAALIGEALAGVPLTLVASSPLRRASATADAVFAVFPSAAREKHSGLREMDFGELEGTVPGDVYAATNAAWAGGDLDHAWPGGEAPADVVARGRQVLASVLWP